MHNLFFIMLFALNFNVYSALNYKTDFSFRSKPQGINLVGTAQYDHLIWGEGIKENPLYGYWRAGAKIGGSPTLAGFLQVAPVAPLIFEISKSMTKRFLNSKEFNCATYECKKSINRLDFSTKIVFGYQNFFGMGSLNFRDIKTSSESKLMALELEYFSVLSGITHRYFSRSLMFGQKYSNDRSFGVAYENGQIKKINKHFENYLGFVKFNYNDLNWIIAASRFNTNEAGVSGNGLILGLSKTFGDSLSLF
jgi:hypothetical protein